MADGSDAAFGGPPPGHRTIDGNEKRRDAVTAVDASALSDEELLVELRSECARWDARDEVEAGFARLFEVRDEALRRGLPLPKSCPLGDPQAPNESAPTR